MSLLADPTDTPTDAATVTRSTDPALRPEGAATRWWRGAQPVYDAILTHPFLRGLTDGTLPAEAFEYYLIQDSHYLRGYSRALALVAAHGHEESDVAFFANSAATAIAVERALHTSLLADFGISAETAASVPVGPATQAYVDSIISVAATGSFVDGVAAVLPCYWVYARVGEALQAASSPDPRYAKWIETYGDPAFQETVATVLDIVDRVGTGLAPAAEARAQAVYRAGSVHEWLFWDAAWTGRAWPSF